MEDTYRTIEGPAEGIFRDRNSRFLAFGFPVESVDRVNELLTTVRKKYHDARHHCYAYRLGNGGLVYRMNDDGEPSGTAGKPIYNQLLTHELTNILVVVVRYFGGTLLGTGGLINAYKSAAADMISNSTMITRFNEVRYSLNFPYEKLSAVMKVLKEENLLLTDHRYDAQCMITVSVRLSLTDKFLQKIGGLQDVIATSFE